MPDFEKIANLIKEKNWPIYEISFRGDGFEPYTAFFSDIHEPHNIFSVAKVFTVTAIGMLYDMGKIKTEDKITEILADEVPEGIDPRWHNVTVHDALHHKIGMPPSFLDIDCGGMDIFGRDYLHFLFTSPFVEDPCINYVYTDAAYYLLCRVVEKIAGEPLDIFFASRLLQPLEFGGIMWVKCPLGHCMGATGIYAFTDDVTKLAEVYRLGGEYMGHRIVSKEWVDIVLGRGYELNEITHRIYSDDDNYTVVKTVPGYGKGGMLGQQMSLFPAKNLSCSWTGHYFDDREELLEEIYKII